MPSFLMDTLLANLTISVIFVRWCAITAGKAE
ncbi:MAG: hypothetical protein K0R13_2248 [Propionibacteriaceae bacterium]|nr:hypothetical protein [Propionibacteriaceae bacterium]